MNQKTKNRWWYSIAMGGLVVLLLFGIWYLWSKKKEHYDNQGPVPINGIWGRGSESSGSTCNELSSSEYLECVKSGLANGNIDSDDVSSMNTGGPCITSDKKGGLEYGLYIDDTVCISFDEIRKLPPEKGSEDTAEDIATEEETPNLKIPRYTDCLPPDTDFNTTCQRVDPTFYPLLIDDCNTMSNKRALCGLNTSCSPRNTNFEKTCQEKYDDTYGVYGIESCEEEDKYRATCAKNYLNGRMFDKDKMTPCIDKNLDLDAMCSHYVPHDSMDTTHWGAQAILVGRDGGCYKKNGEGQDVPDNSKAAVVCSSQYEKTIPNVPSYFEKQNYNVFTDCLPMNSNFRNECGKKMNYTPDKVYAVDIMGYDCNPQYARAKCLDLSRIPSLNPSMADFMIQIQSNSVSSQKK